MYRLDFIVHKLKKKKTDRCGFYAHLEKTLEDSDAGVTRLDLHFLKYSFDSYTENQVAEDQRASMEPFRILLQKPKMQAGDLN